MQKFVCVYMYTQISYKILLYYIPSSTCVITVHFSEQSICVLLWPCSCFKFIYYITQQILFDWCLNKIWRHLALSIFICWNEQSSYLVRVCSGWLVYNQSCIEWTKYLAHIYNMPTHQARNLFILSAHMFAHTHTHTHTHIYLC